MDNLLQDLRFAFRMLARKPGFTVVAVVIMALGIGANTAIFSLVRAVLLRPLPFHEPNRLVMVWEDASFIGFPRNTPAPANYADWKSRNEVFEDMAALDSRSFNLTGDGEPEKVQALGVNAEFFPLLGVTPALGRAFLPEEDKPEANRVAIISHKLWQTRYGGERDIISRDILLNCDKHTVVGVMPASFQFLANYIGIWVPLRLSKEEMADRGDHYLQVVARTRPGVTLDQAETNIKAIMAGIARDNPDSAGRLGAYVVPLSEELTGYKQAATQYWFAPRDLVIRASVSPTSLSSAVVTKVHEVDPDQPASNIRTMEQVLGEEVQLRRTGTTLLGVFAALAMLLAALGIYGVLSYFVTQRTAEFGVRMALGAQRADILRLVLKRGMSLALAGVAVGLAASFALTRLMGSLLFEVSASDPRTFGAIAVMLAAVAFLSCYIPARRATRVDPMVALRYE